MVKINSSTAMCSSLRKLFLDVNGGRMEQQDWGYQRRKFVRDGKPGRQGAKRKLTWGKIHRTYGVYPVQGNTDRQTDVERNR